MADTNHTASSKLTLQQMLYAGYRVEGNSQKQAAIMAGCPTKTASQAASRYEKTEKIQAFMNALEASENKSGWGGARPRAGRPASEKTLFLRAFVGPLKPKRKRRLTEEERKEAERQKALRNIEKRRLQKEAEAAANGTVYVKYARTKSSQNQCLLCKSIFVSALNTAKFCSEKCRSIYYKEEQSKRDKQKTLEKKMQPVTCPCCGAYFCRLYIAGRQQNYCSKLCSKKMRYKKLKSENHISLFKTQMRVMVCNALAKKGYNKGTKTEKILGCSFDFLKQHIERQFLKGMSWDNREEWHIDHIIPMASATTQEEAMALNHFTNLRPLWAADNLWKNDKIVSLL